MAILTTRAIIIADAHLQAGIAPASNVQMAIAKLMLAMSIQMCYLEIIICHLQWIIQMYVHVPQINRLSN
jgi:hypothetical protein